MIRLTGSPETIFLLEQPPGAYRVDNCGRVIIPQKSRPRALQTNVRAKRLYEGLVQVGLVTHKAAPGTHRQLLLGLLRKSVSSLLSFSGPEGQRSKQSNLFSKMLKASSQKHVKDWTVFSSEMQLSLLEFIYLFILVFFYFFFFF